MRSTSPRVALRGTVLRLPVWTAGHLQPHSTNESWTRSTCAFRSADCARHLLRVRPRPTPAPDIRLEPGEFTVELNGLKLWFKVSGRGPVCLMPTPAWGQAQTCISGRFNGSKNIFTVVYPRLAWHRTVRAGPSRRRMQWDHLVSDLDALRALSWIRSG